MKIDFKIQFSFFLLIEFDSLTKNIVIFKLRERNMNKYINYKGGFMENKRKNNVLLFITFVIIFICLYMFVFLTSAQEIIAEQWGVKVYSTEFAGGNGTADTPYEISTPEQLARINFLLRTDYANYGDKNYKLIAPIDLSVHDGQNMIWPAMGTSSNPFAGTFDGAGQRITGLNAVANDNACGLFAYSSGVIKNVVILDSKIENASCDNVGGIVGKTLGGVVSSCYVEMSISALNKNNVGGIIGENNATLSQISFVGQVAGKQNVGGICGKSYMAKISNCINSGEIEATSIVGGICGYIASKTSADKTDYTRIVEFCYNKGEVNATDGYGGGIIGACEYSSISSCYNLADLTNCSGIVGSFTGYKTISYVGSFEIISMTKIINCYNKGSLNSKNRSVGGIAYYVDNGEIQNCYNMGSVFGGDRTGGIVGQYVYALYINKCFNYSLVSGGSSVGGILGFGDDNRGNYLEIINCGNSGEINSTGNNTGGIAGYVYSFAEYQSSSGDWETQGEISSCFNTGAIKATNYYVGGILGCLKSISCFENNYNDGKITASQSSYVGGLIGYMQGRQSLQYFKDSFNRGDISGQSNVGGVFGYWKEMSGAKNKIYNVHNFGIVSASSSTYVGNFGGRDVHNGLEYGSCYFLTGYSGHSKGLGTSGGGGTNTSGLNLINGINYQTELGSAYTSASSSNVYGIQLNAFNNTNIWNVTQDFKGEGYTQTREYELKCFSVSPFNSSKELVFDDNVWQIEASINDGQPFLREFYWVYVA